MTKTRKQMKRKSVSIGSLINKLERSIALANMRGDKALAERFRKMLEQAVSGTKFREVSA